MKTHTAIIALALALPARPAFAQQPEGRPPGPPPGAGRQQNERPAARAERPPMPHVPPVVAALDKNHDGVISEDEIAGAAESLRKLANEHGGKLTVRDLLGPPPEEMRRDGARPPGAPQDGGPRPEARGPRDGEQPRNADRPRDGVRREGEPLRNADRPRDGERPRNADRGDKPRGDVPRDGARPEGAPRDGTPNPERREPPRGERPPGDAPRPDGERRPNPEG